MCISVIVAIAGVSYVVSKSTQAQQSDSVQGVEKQQEFAELAGKIQIEAMDFFEKGDFDGGFGHYDANIDALQDSKQKKALLGFKSGFAIMVGRFDEAIVFAKQADSLGSDAVTVRALADAYRARGDKKQALVYYEKLRDTTKPESNDTDNKVRRRGPSLENIIKDLK